MSPDVLAGVHFDVHLDVVRAAPGSTVQDLGRPGLAHLGVTRSGAADRGALRLANRLVGNDEDAAAVEVTLGGLAVRPDADVDLAVTGAGCPVDVDGRPVGRNAVLHVRAGQTVTLGTASRGLRAYLAVRGGVAVPPVLGSRSRDTLAGLGPEPLAAGTRLPVGPPPPVHPHVDVAPVPDPPDGEVALDAVLGPRDDLLPADVVARVGSVRWVVDPASDRVGVRLAAPPDDIDAVGPSDPTGPSDPSDPAARPGAGSATTGVGSIPSEGMVRGAVQVPPSGLPVLFLTDHPTTGGYPVVAVLTDAAADAAGQLRPGQPVRLVLRPAPRL